MRVTGSYLLPASRAAVHEALLDPEVLQRSIPGCDELTLVSPGVYAGQVTIRVAAVKGSYRGRVEFKESSLEGFVFGASGEGGPGFFSGEVHVKLSDADGGTQVDVDAEGQLGGPLAAVAQRLISGVAGMLMKQFFSKIGDQLRVRSTASNSSPADPASPTA